MRSLGSQFSRRISSFLFFLALSLAGRDSSCTAPRSCQGSSRASSVLVRSTQLNKKITWALLGPPFVSTPPNAIDRVKQFDASYFSPYEFEDFSECRSIFASLLRIPFTVN